MKKTLFTVLCAEVKCEIVVAVSHSKNNKSSEQQIYLIIFPALSLANNRILNNDPVAYNNSFVVRTVASSGKRCDIQVSGHV